MRDTSVAPVSHVPFSTGNPVKNLRIHFWGVQGSCALFPDLDDVTEFQRMVSVDSLTKALKDIDRRLASDSKSTISQILGGPITQDRVGDYQRRLNLDRLPIYGGDTTCVSIETADGNLLLLDGGSGMRNCSKNFVNGWPASKPRDVYIFGSHEHLDHRSGIPFSQFCYVKPGFNQHVYGSFQYLHALDERYGVFSRQLGSSTHLDDPIDFRVMSSTFRGYELRNTQRSDFTGESGPLNWSVLDYSEPISVGNATILPFEVYHGSVRCLAYKVSYGSVSFVFCTDHELRHGPDARDVRQKQSMDANARLEKHCQGVDAAYFDGQYFRAEYDGQKGIGVTPPVNRIDWGHGCIEDILERSKKCGIKRTLIGHHDPERTWVAKLELDRWLQKECENQPYPVELANCEDVLDL